LSALRITGAGPVGTSYGFAGKRRPQRSHRNQRVELPLCSSSSTQSARLHLGQGAGVRSRDG